MKSRKTRSGIFSRFVKKKVQTSDIKIVPPQFPVSSFGGRGEHNILEGTWLINDGLLIVRLRDSNFVDWGGTSQLCSETEFEGSWSFDGAQPSKELLRDCVLEIAKDPKLYYYNLTEDNLLFL